MLDRGKVVDVAHDSRGLLVLAELNPDVVVRCDAGDVRFGQVEQLVERATITLGSSGAITASAARAQDVPVAVCAVVGDDEVGTLAVRLLAERGVDVAAVVRRPGCATGMSIVLSDADGDRAMLTFAGTMADLRAADVPQALRAEARHVHVSSVFLQTALQAGLPELLADARAGGATTSLDPGWDPRELWTAVLPVLAQLDYLLPNAQEVRAIARAADLDASDVAAAARSLAALGPAVVVKDGADGALVADHRGVTRIAPMPAEVVDTTGAGDNFDGGFLAALLAGADVVEAARCGVASGSISVQGWGGTGRHATRAEAVGASRQSDVTRPSAVPTKR